MRKTIYILILGIITAIFSCEKSGLIVNCTDCHLDEPEKATIEVRLNYYDPASGLYGAQVNVYDGNLEDSILILSENVNSGEWSFVAFFNKKYTVTATYTANNNTYITVDEAFPKVRYIKDQCEEPCYFVFGNKVNLRLKYPKL